MRREITFGFLFTGLLLKKILLLCCALFFTGCATSFKPVDRENLSYTPGPDTAGIPLSYRYSVLEGSGNTRYANKARYQGLEIIAVKVTNKTDRAMALKTDVDYFVGPVQTIPVSARDVVPVLRQKTGAYAFYFLMMLVNLSRTQVTCDYTCREETTFIPVGLILGPALAFLNMGISSSANGALEREVVANDLYEKVLQPGETASGYLVFRGVPVAPISLKPKR